MIIPLSADMRTECPVFVATVCVFPLKTKEPAWFTLIFLPIAIELLFRILIFSPATIVEFSAPASITLFVDAQIDESLPTILLPFEAKVILPVARAEIFSEAVIIDPAAPSATTLSFPHKISEFALNALFLSHQKIEAFPVVILVAFG